MSIKKSVFVIMPFSATKTTTEDDWTAIYEHVFSPAIEACNYSCSRAMPSTGSLIKSIVESLASATIVLADVTDQNPNVFYELGVRHTLSKRTIIATQDQKYIPSDLKGYWNLQYGIKPGEVAFFKKEIARIIFEIEKNPSADDSPVSEFLNQENRALSRYAQQEKSRKLSALQTEITAQIFRLENYLDDKQSQFGEYIPLDCIRLLLSTRYIDVGKKLLRGAYELERVLVCLSSDFIDKDKIVESLSFAREFRKEVIDIQRRIESGTFEEPEKLTQVAWRSNSCRKWLF